jgi:hypothetical protein
MPRKLKERIAHASLTCSRCLETKPVLDFQKCQGRTTGYQGLCRSCQNRATKNYRERTNQAYWRHSQGTPYNIYTITNPEGQVYVGYTGSRPNVRWAKHRAQYKHGKCSLVKLYESFVKYGIENHTFEVIEQVATRVDAMARETILILQHRALGKDLNTHLSTFRIGQYNKKSGELIKEWETVTEVAKHFGKSRNYFYGTVTKPNRKGTSSGYLWKILPFKDGSFYDPKTKTFTPAIENK